MRIDNIHLVRYDGDSRRRGGLQILNNLTGFTLMSNRNSGYDGGDIIVIIVLIVCAMSALVYFTSGGTLYDEQSSNILIRKGQQL